MKNFSKTHSLLLLFFLLAFFVRVWGIADIASYRGDEFWHIPAAENYVKTGHFTPTPWFQPPLRNILIFTDIKIFGDNPYGWRMQNAVLGALTVFILCLLAKELFPDIRVAYLTGAMLSLDPLHIFLSRSTFEEVPCVCFFLATVYLTVRYIKGSTRSLLPAGIFLGLATAFKWYFLIAAAVLLVYTLAYKSRKEGWGRLRALYILLSFTVLPFSIYLLTYYPWFERGYDLKEFIEVQLYAYRELKTAGPFHRTLVESSSPWQWFTMPVLVIFEVIEKGMWSKMVFYMNNPLVWLLTFPAFIFAAYRIWKDKSPNLLLVLMLFLSVYIPFLLVEERITLHSSLSCLPFAFLSAAFFVVSVLGRVSSDKRTLLYRVIFSAIVIWGLYLYPVVTAKAVPGFLYAPLLAVGTAVH